MNQVFRSNCPRCGDVCLLPEEIALHITPEKSAFAFACPTCHQAHTRPADSRVVNLLVAAGVHVIDPAPEFTYDDLLDFHTLLHYGSDVVGAVLAATPRSQS